MREKDIERAILVECSDRDTRLFKVENGTAYRGPVTRNGRGVVINPATMIRYGLCTGSSDIIGFKRAVLPSGESLCQFVSIEVKDAKGRLSVDQRRFLDMVRSFNGLAGVARSVEDAKVILAGTLTEY